MMAQVDLDKIYPSASSVSPEQQQPSSNTEQPKGNDPARSVIGYGVASLIIGIISLAISLIPLLLVKGISSDTSTDMNYGLFGLIFIIPILAPICVAVIFGGPLVCGILFLISLSEILKNKLDSSYLVKPAIGLVLSLIPILGLFMVK